MTVLRACVLAGLLASTAAVAAASARLAQAVAWRPETAEETAAPAGATSEGAAVPEDAASERPFLPILGVPPRPAPPPAADPPDAAPPTFDHVLKGVIASGAIRWAVFSSEAGDTLVREGDRLGPDATVVAVHAEGVEVSLGGETITVTFRESDPVRVAEFAEPPPPEADGGAAAPEQVRAPPKRQEVIYQDMSRDEVLDVLRKAEEARRARGWVTR